MILFKRDQRGNDDGGAAPQQTSEFIDRGLAGTGRQHGENVPTAGKCGDRLQLLPPEMGEAQSLGPQAPDYRLNRDAISQPLDRTPSAARRTGRHLLFGG